MFWRRVIAGRGCQQGPVNKPHCQGPAASPSVPLHVFVDVSWVSLQGALIGGSTASEAQDSSAPLRSVGLGAGCFLYCGFFGRGRGRGP